MSKILNIGSINIDHVYRVPHFVRPGETLASQSLMHYPGGKGLNQSVALAKAGARVYHAGRVGPDGASMLTIMRDAGVNTDMIGIDGSSTGHTVIQVNEAGQNCIILHAGANHELEKSYIDRSIGSFQPGDILLLQNEVNDIDYCMEAAHQKGMLIAFNPSPIGPAIEKCPLSYVRWFILNEIEGAALTGKTLAEDILDAMASLYPGAAIVLTIGKEGVLYRDREQLLSHGTYDVPVVDTTAAGDTFTGYFLALTASGRSAKEALRLASIASSIAVSRTGASVSIPSLKEAEESQLQLIE